MIISFQGQNIWQSLQNIDLVCGVYTKQPTPKEKNVPSGTVPKSYSLEDVGQRLPSLKLTSKFAAEKSDLVGDEFKGLFNFHPGAILRFRESVPIIKRSHCFKNRMLFPSILGFA